MEPGMIRRLADTCPQCVTAVVPPREVLRSSKHATARYRCPRCGHSWFTSWLLSALEEAS